MERPVEPHDGALRRASALGYPTRIEILRLVRAVDRPLTADDVAVMVGIHRTAAGRHLATLCNAALTSVIKISSPGRGRPRLGYIARTPAVSTDHSYRHLAAMLAEAVRTGQSARATGRAVGARAAPSTDDPIQALVNEAGRLGFEPVARSGKGGTTQIVLQACPFAELADLDPDTVCSLHLGLAEGLAERVGGVEIEGLRSADPHRGGCTLTVRAAQ